MDNFDFQPSKMKPLKCKRRILKNRKGNLKRQLQGIGKVECVVSMVIWSEIRMGQYRDDHREQDPTLKIKEFHLVPIHSAL